MRCIKKLSATIYLPSIILFALAPINGNAGQDNVVPNSHFQGKERAEAKSFELGLFDFEAENAAVLDDAENFETYSINRLVKEALEFGIESQEHMQILFRAGEELKIQIGHVLPQINVLGTAEAAVSQHIAIHTVLPLVGFLFPNRWFTLKGTRLIQRSAEVNIGSVFANQVQEIEHLYYEIQTQVWSLRVMDFYIHQLDRTLAFMEDNIRHGSTRFSAEHMSVLINRRANLKYRRAFMDSLAASYPEMASLIGLSPDHDWSTELKLEPLEVNFDDKPKRKYSDFYDDAVARSTEIKSLELLIEAAKRDIRTTYVDVLDPHTGHDIGYGYRSRIKIARSEIASLRLGIQDKKLQISNAIQRALNYYTESTVSLKYLREGLANLEHTRTEAERQLIGHDTPFEFPVVDRFFQIAENQTLNIIYAYFVYRTAVADFDRLIWAGENYQTVNEYQNTKIPEFLKSIKREHSFKHRAKRQLERITS